MTVIIAGVQRTVKTTGEYEAWEKTIIATRAKLWKALFDITPELMVTNVWDCLEDYIDFEVIDSSDRPAYVKWQRYIRSMFIALADTVYVHRVALGGKNPTIDPNDPDSLIRYNKFTKAKKNAVGKAGKVFKQIFKTLHSKLGLSILINFDLLNIFYIYYIKTFLSLAIALQSKFFLIIFYILLV